MNTEQLETLAFHCPLLRSHFKGVFASDMLPQVERTDSPRSYIINLDPQDKPGSHWVCMYFPQSGLPEYMDSYGATPLPHFDTFLTHHYRCNKNMIQSPFSAVCGQYCLYYLLQRSQLSSMDKVLAPFELNSFFNNDIIVNTYVSKHFDTWFPYFDIPWQLKQLCKPFNCST